MKIYILIAAMALSSVLCADEKEVISIYDMNQEMMENLPQNAPFPFIIKLPKGAEMPTSIGIRGEFFSGSTEGNEAFRLNVLQDLYITWVGEELSASLDGEIWKPIQEFFTGSIGWSINDDSPAKLGFFLEANKR